MTYFLLPFRQIFLITLLFGSFLPSQAQKTRKAMFVIVDGIPADVIQKVKTPSLDAIAKVGGYAKAFTGGEKNGYSESPTISAVGYNNLLTGTWANKHNVKDNNITSPNYHYPTIFRFFKEQYPQKKTAIFSTWQDNRTKLAGDQLPAAGNIRIDFHLDGLELDTVKYPHDSESNYIHKIDEAVVDAAVVQLKGEAPDLSWVYLQYTDNIGHKYGDSEAFYKAVELMDNQIGKLWAAIQERQKTFDEEWQLWITTDHGREAETGKGHGGQSARERSIWIVTNAQGLNDYFRKGKAAIVDIMPTIARFLEVNIPRENLMELDGVPLTGNLYLNNLRVRLSGEEIYVSWRSDEKRGDVKIWLSTTDHFKLGAKDTYLLQATVPLKKEEATIDVSKRRSFFYKVVIETPGGMFNRWIHVKKK